MNTGLIGKYGENLVCSYLIDNGYEILCKNFSCCLGEIDIIAKRDKHIAFVEVKTRKDSKFGFGADSVNFYKQQKIIKTAKFYLLNCQDYEDVSFDVCEVYTLNRTINYIENAFEA